MSDEVLRGVVTVWVEQAIFTSMARRGRSGYHVVASSPGVSESEAASLVTWSPSHGALLVDALNRSSVNFHPLPGGRFALSRTCEGPPEYSGRGGRQLYTHALILDEDQLRQAGRHPISLYWAALALGILRHRADPDPVLKPVKLPTVYSQGGVPGWQARAREIGLPALEPLRDKLASCQAITVPYPGNRIVLAEYLLGTLPGEMVSLVSFATSLQPSAVRPFRLSLVNGKAS
jgi:hypothetical protein